jgi:hypothetical protein
MLLADVGDSVQRGFDEFAEWVPRLLAFIAILVIGYFIAKIVGSLLARLLHRAGLDRTLHSGTAGTWISKVTSSPSRLLGQIAFWAILVGAISIALDALGIAALDDFVGTVWGYIPNVIAALLIFLIAGAIAAGVGALVARTMGDTSTGKVVGTVVPVLIMAIAGFMILDQLKIAEEIVTITYASLMGAIALGMALAFGLGGRDVAARLLEGAYEKGQENREQVKRDLRQGRERARQDAERAREQAQVDAEGDTVIGPRGSDADIAFEPEAPAAPAVDRPARPAG